MSHFASSDVFPTKFLPPMRIWLILLMFTLAAATMRADVAVLLEQPWGELGRLVGTGHVSLYLSRVCVDQPNHLRRCGPGENGVVVGRYHNADGYDWTAIPLLPYLYAVEEPEEIPASVDHADVARLRNDYRRAHLESLVPDDAYREHPHGHWTQLVGAAYRRRIYIFEVKTTPEQDDRLIQKLNSEPNRPDFNLFFHNCANFAESILNFYFPGSIHRSFTVDLGLATPKQIAKSLESYARRHDNLDLSVFMLPQIPGKIHRSGKNLGVLETLLKKKQYVIPLVVWQPYVVAALAGTYLLEGRFNPNRDAVVLHPDQMERALLDNMTPPFGRSPGFRLAQSASNPPKGTGKNGDPNSTSDGGSAATTTNHSVVRPATPGSER